MRFLLVAFLLLLACLAQADEIEVVSLKYRTAEQVIPVLRPLVEPGGAVTGMQSTLVIRGSRRAIDNVRQALAALDRMPRRLMIQVRQDTGVDAAQSGIGVGGVIGSGGANVEGRVYSSRGASDERVSQTVQVLEGNPAYITVGQSVPVVTRSTTTVFGGAVIGGQVADNVQYRDVATGFSVVPRLSGDRVVLDINPQRQSLEPPGGPFAGPQGQPVVRTQSAATTVSGKLGEWIDLGGMVQDERRGERGILSSRDAARTDNRRVWVRVEEIR